MVKVYSFEGCPYCDKTKRYLQARGVEYEVRDVELNLEYAEELEHGKLRLWRLCKTQPRRNSR